VFGVGLWNNIRRGLWKFSSHTRFEVGDGLKVKLCHDLWCGDMALIEVFLDLYGISCAKDDSVVALLEPLVGSIKWNINFARVAHDWEVDVFASFLMMVYLTRERQGRCRHVVVGPF
jgi:hypothetical protein